MNKKTKLHYVKMILEKVSFEESLFWKEYRKAFSFLDAHEVVDFERWFRQRFPSKYKACFQHRSRINGLEVDPSSGSQFPEVKPGQLIYINKS